MGFNKPGGNVDGEDISPASVSTDDLSVNGQNGLELPQDKASSRSLDTWETNTTGSPIIVAVVVVVAGSDAVADDYLRIIGDVNDSQSVNRVTEDIVQTSDGSALSASLRLFVPTQAEYQVRLNSDTANSSAIGDWHEQQLGI